MTTTAVELFRHNLWANLRLLDVCAGLRDAQLDASAPGTYGRVRDTLVHILAAEERYVAALTGRAPEHPLREAEGFPGFPELRQRARRSGEELVRLAGEVEPSALLTGTRRGASYEMRAAVPLIQAINHATEHRAHVVTVLSQAGLEPPIIDGWKYGEENGLLQMGNPS